MSHEVLVVTGINGEPLLTAEATVLKIKKLGKKSLARKINALVLDAFVCIGEHILLRLLYRYYCFPDINIAILIRNDTKLFFF